MGADGWIYYVPYQENLEKALQELRQHVFETGQYSVILPGEWVVDISGEEMDISQMQEVMEQEDGSLLPVHPIQAAMTTEEKIGDLLKRCEGGTHSILDIHRLITDTWYFGDVILPDDVIQHIFAGAKPTRTIVEAIISHEKIWLHLNGAFQAERMSLARYKRPGLFHFCEDILQFFATPPPKEEIVEVLLTREAIWTGIHSCLCFVLETQAMFTRYGTAMPFSSDDLLFFFSHEKPTRADVEAAFAEREIWEHMRVGVGYYAVIYEDSAPQEIVFAGFSGD